MSRSDSPHGSPPDAEPAAPRLPGLDLAAVVAWLDRTHPDVVRGPVSAQLVAGGRSNLTYVLDDGTRRLVLRRPPLGHVLATAHDMTREHRMISALADTAVPVPQALALCEDGDVTGAPFYVMSYVDGAVLRSHADLAGIDAGGRERLARSMVAVLADLHGVDVEAAGLTGFGRPEGFMARQVRRWATQLDGSRSRDLPGVDDLRDALGASVPTPPDGAPYPAAVVHGDYRLDNLVVARADEPEVVGAVDDGASAAGQAPPSWPVRAVLDWEMATVGDPLADLGLLLAYWDGLGGSQSVGDNPVAQAIGPRAGFPEGERLVAWYAERSGADLTTLPWYVAFGFFKIAVILEGIHYRYAQGQTVGAGFDRIGDVVPVLVTLGREAIHPST